MRRQSLIIPSENRAREFDGKLLLGCVAAEAGFRVIVGSRHDIHNWIDYLPRSIYLSKDLRASSETMIAILAQLGHTFVAWDEEALVYHSRDQYLASRVSPVVLAQAKLLFAWGSDNAEIWRSHPAYGGVPIVEVGNPRLDLLQNDLRPFFSEQTARLRREFGGYILVNSNFGSVNHLLPQARDMTMRHIRSEPARVFHENMLAYRAELFSRFLKAIPSLSQANLGLSIVVRPHPSEDPAPWQRAAAGLQNVHVRADGNVIPWLLGARVLVHNGCTTAIEAQILRRPTIAYQPMTSAPFDIALPNAISHSAGSLQELNDLIARLPCVRETLSAGEAPRHRLLDRYLSDGDGSLSSDRIVAALKNWAAVLENPCQTRPMTGWRGRLEALRRRRRKLRAANIDGHKNSLVYNEHRFQPVSVPEVAASIARLSGCLGRFDGVAVRELRPNVFELEQAP